MIALFLKAEIGSNRWRSQLLTILDDLKCPVEWLENPDITRYEHNERRALVLAQFRGYGKNRDIFENYPVNVNWQWVSLDRTELVRTRYVDYSYWNEISGGSRCPVDAVETIRKGIEVYGVSNRGFWEGVRAVRRGIVWSGPILVAPDPDGALVILEGHVRFTIYALAGKDAPQEIRSLLGLSPEFASWL